MLFAIAAAGCGNSSATPTQPLLSDPNEIVSRSIAQLATETTVHLDGTVNGTVDAGSISALVGFGTGGLSGNIKLDNASLSGDVDIPKQAAKLSATFPTLFGLSGEAILVDGYSYIRFGTSSTKYTKSKVSASLLMPSAAPDATLSIAGALGQLKTLIGSRGVTATLLERESVSGRDAYHVTVGVPAELLNGGVGAVGGAAASGVTLDLARIDYWVYVDSLQPARLHLKVSSTTLGNIELTVTLTKYGQPVTIQAPPDGQVGT